MGENKGVKEKKDTHACILAHMHTEIISLVFVEGEEECSVTSL